MQYYTPVPNAQPKQLTHSKTMFVTQELDAYLTEQAIQFAQQKFLNIQPYNQRPQGATLPRAHTYQDLKIQPLYSDKEPVAPVQQYNQATNIQLDDLDAYLTKQAEEFARANLKTRSEGSTLNYLPPQPQLNNTPYMINQQNVQVQQIPQMPVQYYVPQPHPQPQRHQAQVRQTRQVRDVQNVQPAEVVQKFVVEQPQRQRYTPLAQVKPKELVLPSPMIRQEQFNPYMIQQAGQAQFPSTNAEAIIEKKMEFVKKGPRGEALYKIVEGGVNYYVKRGLTPEAVCNYKLAHILGVGPPVEILENDGVKMEEGVCIRQAIRGKLITVDEAFKQVQALHKRLFDSGMAHCDVKFENCLYFPQYGKVLLIDNGDLAVYGNKRTIKTAGANSTLLISPNEHHRERNMVGPATDLGGFMHVMMNAIHDG